jgi:signal transduction histidine kinase
VAGNTEKLSRYFQRIRQSGERLLMLLNKLLDLSKLEAGKMHVELARHDLLPLIDEAGAELEMLFTQRNLKLLIEPARCSTKAICDPTRFGQVIHNLLSNAIKFSPDGGQITISFVRSSISAGRRTDDGTIVPTLSVTVSDQGVGIPPDELDTIFDKFVQSSKTKNGAGGTGLGLSICREIMNAHRGTIEACNNPQRGASFILQLPIAPSPFIHSAPREAQ